MKCESLQWRKFYRGATRPEGRVAPRTFPKKICFQVSKKTLGSPETVPESTCLKMSRRTALKLKKGVVRKLKSGSFIGGRPPASQAVPPEPPKRFTPRISPHLTPENKSKSPLSRQLYSPCQKIQNIKFRG